MMLKANLKRKTCIDTIENYKYNFVIAFVHGIIDHITTIQQIMIAIYSVIAADDCSIILCINLKFIIITARSYNFVILMQTSIRVIFFCIRLM